MQNWKNLLSPYFSSRVRRHRSSRCLSILPSTSVSASERTYIVRSRALTSALTKFVRDSGVSITLILKNQRVTVDGNARKYLQKSTEILAPETSDEKTGSTRAESYIYMKYIYIFIHTYLSALVLPVFSSEVSGASISVDFCNYFRAFPVTVTRWFFKINVILTPESRKKKQLSPGCKKFLASLASSLASHQALYKLTVSEE